MTWDRSSKLALLLASGSVLVNHVSMGNLEFTLRYACALVLPLGVILYPEESDYIFRRSWHGIAHGGEGPAPAAIIRVAAWILLIAITLIPHGCAVIHSL